VLEHHCVGQQQSRSNSKGSVLSQTKIIHTLNPLGTIISWYDRAAVLA